MIIAQAAGEYGAMAGLSAALQASLARVEGFIGSLDGRDLLVIAVVAVVLLKVFGRRR